MATQQRIPGVSLGFRVYGIVWLAVEKLKPSYDNQNLTETPSRMDLRLASQSNRPYLNQPDLYERLSTRRVGLTVKG